MAPSSPAVKRLFSALPEQPTDNNAKRIKRPYHHHHRLHEPVNPGLLEPAIADDSYVDQVMNRTISHSLRECGFEIADPLALESFRDAAEECMCIEENTRSVLLLTRIACRSPEASIICARIDAIKSALTTHTE
jgi:hypothetical protein